MSGKEPVVNCGAGRSYVEKAGRAGGNSDSYLTHNHKGVGCQKPKPARLGQSGQD